MNSTVLIRRKPGTYAANCLMARRLAERGVRFIQLYHRGWDQHNDLPRDLALQCKGTDQASAALVTDLKQRGLLDDTLVVWGGEFGRTVYCQGHLTKENYGRDHHPRCFCHVVCRRRHQARLHAGRNRRLLLQRRLRSRAHSRRPGHRLHCLGIDHKRLTYKFQGRHFRLTDIAGNVNDKVLA